MHMATRRMVIVPRSSIVATDPRLALIPKPLTCRTGDHLDYASERVSRYGEAMAGCITMIRNPLDGLDRCDLL